MDKSSSESDYSDTESSSSEEDIDFEASLSYKEDEKNVEDAESQYCRIVNRLNLGGGPGCGRGDGRGREGGRGAGTGRGGAAESPEAAMDPLERHGRVWIEMESKERETEGFMAPKKARLNLPKHSANPSGTTVHHWIILAYFTREPVSLKWLVS